MEHKHTVIDILGTHKIKISEHKKYLEGEEANTKLYDRIMDGVLVRSTYCGVCVCVCDLNANFDAFTIEFDLWLVVRRI